jgi:hypothetical protein
VLEVSPKVLQWAIEAIEKQLQSLEDLPEELADSIANVYYRAGQIILEDRGAGSAVAAIAKAPQVDGMARAYADGVRTLEKLKIIPQMVAGLRCIDKDAQPNFYQMTWRLHLDILKYNISNAEDKPEIWRMLERPFRKAESEIPRLADLITKIVKTSRETKNKQLQPNQSPPLAAAPVTTQVSRAEVEAQDASRVSHRSQPGALRTVNSEFVVNLWAVYDAGTGLVYALSGRAYLASGTDNEKLAFLQQRAATDHATAKRHEVPGRFQVSFSDGTVQKKVAKLSAVSDPNAQLFEELFRNIESELAAQTTTAMVGAPKLAMNPLCVTTVLYEDDDGSIRPIITNDDREWVAAQERARGRQLRGI